MADQRLPIVDGDDGQWGEILNQFLEKEHYNTGSNNADNGMHKTVTIRAGTASAGTAPLKFTSGTSLTTPEAGAMEFNSDSLFFTTTTGPTRKTIAWADFTNVSGTLTVSNGGTGATTLTGIVKGNGTSAFTAVTAPSGDIVGTTDTQTLTNKDISGSSNTYRSASDTVTGAVELATASETTTGTDTARAVTPDGLAGSNFGKRVIEVLVTDPNGSALTTGDGKAYITIPSELNGYNMVDADAAVTTASSSGTPTIQIHNVTDSQDMLSTSITIDANEKTSYTAATAPVINTSYDDVATGDILRVDVDTAGTGAKGLMVILSFQVP